MFLFDYAVLGHYLAHISVTAYHRGPGIRAAGQCINGTLNGLCNLLCLKVQVRIIKLG